MSELRSRILLILGDPQTDLEQAIILRQTLTEVELDMERTDEMIRSLILYVKGKIGISEHRKSFSQHATNSSALGLQHFGDENTPPV